MKTSTLLATAGITGVVLAVATVSPALAWHPVGIINKSVQDETTSSALVDANDASDALTVNTGDVLKYVIAISNNGTAASNGNNDMAQTVLVDTLPDGVELVNGNLGSTRVTVGTGSSVELTASLGTVKAGTSITETYEVKVVSKTDGDVLTNKACFTGNSLANDNPQSGCDTAVVKLHVPPTPTPTPKPIATPKLTPRPTVLPNTGAGDFIVPAVVASVLGYTGYLLRSKRHAA